MPRWRRSFPACGSTPGVSDRWRTAATTSAATSLARASSSSTTARGVQAFYNVCRHRGTRLCDRESGAFAGSIQCPYHAWTYDLAGRLIGAPLMDDVEGFRA